MRKLIPCNSDSGVQRHEVSLHGSPQRRESLMGRGRAATLLPSPIVEIRIE